MNPAYKFIMAAAAVACFSAPALAFDKAAAEKLLHEKIDWLSNPVIIDSIKAQNEKNASLTEDDIKALDEKWKAGDASVMDPSLNNPLSDFLKKVVTEGGGLYTEIFVMDNKGLNVGQSAPTSDYWQGDEPKWQSTYKVGPGAVEVSDVEFDESTQTYQVQVSTTIVDGETPIGAVTIAVDAEKAE